MLKIFSFHITSPTKAQFSSCKDVALHLKSLVETNGANPLDEGAMMLVDGDTDSPVECDLVSKLLSVITSINIIILFYFLIFGPGNFPMYKTLSSC